MQCSLSQEHGHCPFWGAITDFDGEVLRHMTVIGVCGQYDHQMQFG